MLRSCKIKLLLQVFHTDLCFMVVLFPYWRNTRKKNILWFWYMCVCVCSKILNPDETKGRARKNMAKVYTFFLSTFPKTFINILMASFVSSSRGSLKLPYPEDIENNIMAYRLFWRRRKRHQHKYHKHQAMYGIEWVEIGF
jgi:hypothetical protein